MVILRFLKRAIARLLGRRPPLPGFQDPYAGVREPRRRGPGGRSSAVAVLEPERDESVRAIGR